MGTKELISGSKIENAILSFLKQKEKGIANESEVVLHINTLGLGVRETVRSALSRMELKGIVKIERFGRGKAQRISIDNDSELLNINNELNRIGEIIEGFIQKMKRPAHRIINYRYRQDGNADVLQELIFPHYYMKTSIVLGILLTKAIKLRYQPDSRIYQSKILELLQKLASLALQSDNEEKSEKEYLKSSIREIEATVKILKKSP